MIRNPRVGSCRFNVWLAQLFPALVTCFPALATVTCFPALACHRFHDRLRSFSVHFSQCDHWPVFYLLALSNTCLVLFQSSSRHSCACTRVAGRSLTSSRGCFDSATLPRRGGKVAEDNRDCCLFSVIRRRRLCENKTRIFSP